jgi:hypothetical protein
MSSNNVINIPIGGSGGGGGTINTGTWSNGALTLTASGYGSQNVYNSSTMTISGVTVDGDESEITIQMKDGKKVHVVKSINLILEHLMMIVPDEQELNSNPALKLAYENYLQVIRQQIDPKIAEAYETYQTVRKLTRDE